MLPHAERGVNRARLRDHSSSGAPRVAWTAGGGAACHSGRSRDVHTGHDRQRHTHPGADRPGRRAGAAHRRGFAAIRPRSRSRDPDPVRHRARALRTIVTALSDFGLTFLMFLAGTELDLATIREGHLGPRRNVVSRISGHRVGRRSRAPRDGPRSRSVVVALCLTTTALGTLLPILAMRGRFVRLWVRRSCRSGRSGSSARSWRSPSCSGTVTPR